MDAKELRIGNIIRHIKDKESKEVVSIDYLIDLDNNKEGYVVNSSWLDEFEPIPLTEEILLKCGYIKQENEMYRVMGHSIWNVQENMFVSNKNGIILRSLHQLQNLYFAITGEELTVNL